jgi:putative tryptophan/tyrosine transport system substrate-binding protein
MKRAAVPSTLVAVVLLVLGVTAEAQQPKKVPQIGHLTPVSLSAMASRYEAFRQGLRELSYVEGKKHRH